MKKQIEKEIKEEVQKKDYQEFFQYLGINPEDFGEKYDSIDFDDYSR